jgi:intracellular sulfur oxidation DsrE/DsrF family protein
MDKHELSHGTDRRQFLSKLTAGAATMGMVSLFTPFQQLQATVSGDHPAHTAPSPTGAFGTAGTTVAGEADEWFKKVKGRHRIIFDVPGPNDLMPFAWPRVFLLTNQATGSAASDCGIVVVLRHNGIPYAFNSDIWAKYNFGEVFKANDPATKKPSMRNPFWKPAKGDFKVPGLGEVEIGINELQDSGVMFCVCDVAMTVFSAALAEGMKMDPADVKKEWMSGLLPGIQVVPSGIWGVGRAQEHGCSYCFAG